MQESIVRGTTPLLNIALLNNNGRVIDVSGYDSVECTISDGVNKTTIEKEDMTFNSDKSIDVFLTQSETLAFDGYEVMVQLRAKKDDNVIASDIYTMDLCDLLKGGQI